MRPNCRWDNQTRAGTPCSCCGLDSHDINVMQEMVDLMTAQRAYDANANVVEATRDMAMTAIGIGR